MLENAKTTAELEDEIRELKSKLVVAEQRARDLELKLKQKSAGSGADWGSSTDLDHGSGVRNLQDHNKQQAQLVLSLKDEIRQLKAVLEVFINTAYSVLMFTS